MTQRCAHISLRVVGVLAILLAVAGLMLTADSSYRVASGSIEEVASASEAPFLREAFYVAASVWVIFYVVLAYCGIQFLRLRSGLWWLFVAVLAAEVITDFTVAWLWSHPTLGRSMAVATAASGGLMFQLVLLFPLWAPVLVYLARENRRDP